MTQVGTGIDRNTGKLLSGWDHVVQSILTIMTTAYGERMLRRWFGSSIPQRLYSQARKGRNAGGATSGRFAVSIGVGIA